MLWLGGLRCERWLGWLGGDNLLNGLWCGPTVDAEPVRGVGGRLRWRRGRLGDWGYDGLGRRGRCRGFALGNDWFGLGNDWLGNDWLDNHCLGSWRGWLWSYRFGRHGRDDRGFGRNWFGRRWCGWRHGLGSHRLSSRRLRWSEALWRCAFGLGLGGSIAAHDGSRRAGVAPARAF